MDNIIFTSRLPEEHYATLNEIMFFNEGQSRFFREIEKVVEDFGMPEVVREEGLLKIRVGEIKDTQYIYALDPLDLSPIGVVVFIADTKASLLILHVAITPEYSFSGSHNTQGVFRGLVLRVLEVAKAIKGVHSVKLAYTGDKTRMVSIPVRQDANINRQEGT